MIWKNLWFWAGLGILSATVPAEASDPKHTVPDTVAAVTVLPDIVVSGRSSERETSRRELDVTEIDRLAGFGGDALKSLQALPGVARPALFQPGAIVVRGSGRFDTRFLLDGVDIPLLFHYGGVTSTYDSRAMQSVDLYPGGYSTRYGGCVGGVVEIRGRSGRADAWHREVDVSLLDASVMFEGPLRDNLTLLFNARRSYAGEVVRRAIADNDDVSMVVVPYYWDVVGRLDWTPTVDDDVFLSVFAAKDRMELIFPEANEGSAEVTQATDAVAMSLAFHRVILGWDRFIGGSFTNEMRASLGRSQEKGNTFGYFRFDSDAPLASIRDQLTWDVAADVSAHVGLDMIRAPVRYNVKAVGWPESDEHDTFSDLAAYVGSEIKLGDRATLNPGLRWDHYSHLDEGRGSLRLSGRYIINDRHVLTASAGSYNQSPQPIGQSTDPVYGNPDLPPTRAMHLTLGDEFVLGTWTSAKIEAYYNTQNRIPAYADTLGVSFLPDAEGRMFGLELMFRHTRPGGFFGWISLGLSRSDRRYQRRPSNDITTWSADDWVPYQYDQPLHLEVVGSWPLGRGWSFGSRLQYVTGNPDTPLLSYGGGVFEFDADNGSYIPVSGEYLSDRYDPYLRLDIRLDRSFGWLGAAWTAYFDVQHALASLYNSPEGYVYNYDFTEREGYGGITLPTIGLRVSF